MASPNTRGPVGSRTEEWLSSFIIGDSPAIRRVRDLIGRLGPTDVPVLVYGPTGSGKELVAAALHHVSRRSGAFVGFNVGAASEGLFESALFGHVRGAFTGAIADAPGYLLEADGGTLFLDEISSLPIKGQAALLRALELRSFRPVGGKRDRQSRFHLVAASNENLAELATTGRFRLDLLHRLQGAVIHLPPLAERLEDIPALARHFTARGTETVPGKRISDAAIDALCSQPWSGNVRELMHVVQCAGALATNDTITRSVVVEALALRLPDTGGSGTSAVRASGHQHRRRAEADALLQILETANWDIDAVAASLGVHRATVYRRIHRHGIQLP